MKTFRNIIKSPSPITLLFDEAVKLFAQQDRDIYKDEEVKHEKHFQAIEIIFDVIIISICYTRECP